MTTAGISAAIPDGLVSGLEGVVAFTSDILEPDDVGALRYRGIEIPRRCSAAEERDTRAVQGEWVPARSRAPMSSVPVERTPTGVRAGP